MSTGMPRRNDLLLNVPAELRIRDAIGAIERMEADQYLSLAQSKLEEALNLGIIYLTSPGGKNEGFSGLRILWNG